MPLFSDRLYTSQNSDLKREARMSDEAHAAGAQ